jgi:CHU_C Type IX secretion signal domain
MKRLILILFLATPFLVKASHIVGGELALVHIPGTLYRYRIEMILYYDLHGNTGGDLSATVRIFRKSNNQAVSDRILTALGPINRSNPNNVFAIGIPVSYYQPECSSGSIETNKVSYTSGEFELSPTTFNEPEGYYMVYERCCRNYTINNIISKNPQNSSYSEIAGQIFYLEFPAVIKNNEPFINSSPKLFPPLSDYACPNRSYFVDFAGTDEDGDSLAYSIVTPLNSVERLIALPPNGPNPGPYDSVLFADGFSNTNFMKGTPDLRINDEGLLTVTPTIPGLYVFAVRCSEFRNGVKIGEVRRDFQMLVQNFCATAVPPIITGKKQNEAEFLYRDNMNVVFPPLTQNSDRCIQVRISDLDIQNDFDGFKEKIKIVARAVGNKKNIGEVILPSIKIASLTATNPVAIFNICFDECPLIPNVPYFIQIIAFDDACALPLSDTLRISVLVEIPENSPVQFASPVPNAIDALNEGDPEKLWPVKVVDAEDNITMAYLTDGFDLAHVGMDLDFAQPGYLVLEDTLIWNPTCDKYDFSVKRNFRITLIADDSDLCNYNVADTAYFDLTLIPPPNADPIIDTDLTAVYSERLVDGGQYRIYDAPIQFKLFGHDDDVLYPISFEAEGIGFNMADFGMSFTPVSGLPDIQSPFSWTLNCEPFHLAEKDSFAIQFRVVDKNNKCKIYQADTVDIGFRILPPVNVIPEITAQNLHPETTIDANTASTFWDKPVEFRLTGTDEFMAPQRDNISIEIIDAEGDIPPEGYTFTPVSGQDQIETNFSWNPDCSIFRSNIFSNDYEFTFRVFDNHCESASADTVTIHLNIKDYVSTDEFFQPINAITPNADGINDFFAFDGYDLRDNGTDPDNDVNLPLDNCQNQFEYINIYNRWGKLVFTSTNRYFRWHAPEAAAGVYFYFMKFTKQEYKSSVMVRY